MKKLVTALASFLLVFSLSGCEDAKANVSNPKEPILTVGSKTITKNDVNTVLSASIGSQVAVTNALKTVTSKEVEETEEIKNQAKSELENLKQIYGEGFETILKQMNTNEEDYMQDYILPMIKTHELNKIYVDENFDELVKQYDPMMVTVLSFANEEDANAALAGLNDGSLTPLEASEKYEATTRGNSEIVTLDTYKYDALTLAALRSMSESDGFTVVQDESGSMFNVVKVDSKDVASFKDEFVAFVSNNPAFTMEVNEYYFKKYNFHVYDITLYNALKQNQPNLLVQDIKEEK